LRTIEFRGLRLKKKCPLTVLRLKVAPSSRAEDTMTSGQFVPFLCPKPIEQSLESWFIDWSTTGDQIDMAKISLQQLESEIVGEIAK
ncbi:MAG: hypothetical protein MK213_04295, partial [Planctomycetes bacterium]|nr:hypothetical protein [Planctomycetota bacterium]